MSNSYLYFSDDVIEAIKKRFGGDANFICYMNILDKKNYMTYSANEGLKSLLDRSVAPIVINYKMYKFNNYTHQSLLNIKNELFIYCDRSYPNSISIINNLTLNNKAKCRFLEFENMFVLIAKICDSRYFILPILPIAFYQALKDIKEGNLNLELADNVDGVTLLDEYIFTSDYEVDRFNLIINSLFNL